MRRLQNEEHTNNSSNDSNVVEIAAEFLSRHRKSHTYPSENCVIQCEYPFYRRKLIHTIRDRV